MPPSVVRELGVCFQEGNNFLPTRQQSADCCRTPFPQSRRLHDRLTAAVRELPWLN